jgi:hypothetical protein
MTGAYHVFRSATRDCQMNLGLTAQLSPTVTYRIHPLRCSCTVDPVGMDQPLGFVMFFLN